MRKKKHSWHCEKCHSECTAYKKGKGHRVLVCPHCGVIATNPFSMRGLLGSALGSVPIVGGVAEYAVENIGTKEKTSPQIAHSLPSGHRRPSIFKKIIDEEIRKELLRGE